MIYDPTVCILVAMLPIPLLVFFQRDYIFGRDFWRYIFSQKVHGIIDIKLHISYAYNYSFANLVYI